MKKVIILSGPTCTGKTSTAVALAKRFSAQVVNFDSLLFYRELNIGTAKPTSEERAGVPHHLIDIRSISEAMNAADFVALARPLIESLQGPVLLAGGSGFYLQALVEGMWNSPTTPADVQKRSDDLYAAEGIAPFRAFLSEHDRESFLRLHENDHYRIRRATEHFWAHGTAFSKQREAFAPTPPPEWQLLHLHLDLPKEDHLALIRQRTRAMLQAGLVEEVKGLLAQGYTGLERPLGAIGYKETLDWLRGVYLSESEFEERIVINTRQLAKAQRTWFKRKEKRTFDPRGQFDELVELVDEFLRAPG